MEMDKRERRGANKRIAQVISISGGGGCVMKIIGSTVDSFGKLIRTDKYSNCKLCKFRDLPQFSDVCVNCAKNNDTNQYYERL